MSGAIYAPPSGGPPIYAAPAPGLHHQQSQSFSAARQSPYVAPKPAPTTDLSRRQVDSVTPPITRPPRNEDFFVADVHTGINRPNLELLRTHFFHEGRLTEDQALFILDQTTQMLSTEPNMLQIDGPVTVCGDIHGQYYDLMKILDVGGSFADNTYLFLGDYVDRGYFGLECLLFLYAVKLWYPTKIFLLRGNHECRHLTEYFTFKRECMAKYDATVYDACIRSFQALPVAALIEGKFFCVHGGISPELDRLEDLEAIDRFCEPASHGLLCDLLWADPVPNFGHEQEPSRENPPIPPGTSFLNNHTRGCSYYYTYEAVCKFLERNQLLGMFRGHEAQDAGYTMHRKTPTKKFPSVITIFSAPNYLDLYHNRGAVIKYRDRNITIRQYNWASHPYWLPNFMDAFTWSLPFVGAKIIEMLLAILSVCSEQELEEDSTSYSGDDDVERARELADIREEEEDDDDDTRTIAEGGRVDRRQAIRSKILAVGRMQRVFELLRAESENATELAPEEGEPSWPGGFTAPAPTLGVPIVRAQQYIRSFADARRSDIANERLPQFEYDAATGHPLLPAPSMRLPGLAADGERGTLEELIRKALEEEGLHDGGVVERLADRIARGRRPTGRPRALKRFETA